MLYQYQLQDLAEKAGVRVRIVEKDWVLGHFLDTVYNHTKWKNRLIFKGGTCLRKCYFPNYRFSEDLDFILTESKHRISKEDIDGLAALAESKSGIRFFVQKFGEQRSKNEGMGYQAVIGYWGANHKPNQVPTSPEDWHDKIKLDISYSDYSMLPIQNRPLYHHYPDADLIISESIISYCLEEILAEKLRALIQRNRPRDCYDIWSVINSNEPIDWTDVKSLFIQKMKHKQMVFTGPEQLIDQRKTNEMMRSWDRSLALQVSDGRLPNPEVVMKELKQLIFRLF